MQTGGWSLVAVAGRWRREHSASIVTAILGPVVCVVAVAAAWAFPLSRDATARLIEKQRPGDGPVRCVSQPRPGGYPEFGSQLLGRTYVCGYKRLGAWDGKGGIRLGQGAGYTVDDTHVVKFWP